MLILLPPSEGKTQRARGRRLDLGTLSHPELNALREAVIDAVADVSAGPDAHQQLGVSPRLVEEVARNTRLRTAATAPASDVYSGVLYDAFDVAGLDAAGRRRANRAVLVVSALFGLVRLTDRIPAYRLNMCVDLPGVGELTGAWRSALGPVLEAEAARHGVLVDCRSSTYASVWHPRGELAERRVHVVVPGASHMAKHTRGLVARALVASPDRPRTPEDLGDVLADDFHVELSPPPRPGKPWQLSATARH